MSPEDNSSSLLSHSSASRVSGPPPSPSPPLAPRRPMYHIPFVPRPFPPPALADVPLEYIVDQLRRLAPYYWSRPETSDCTILVSLDNEPVGKLPPSTGVCDALSSMHINPAEPLDDALSPPGMKKSIRPRRMIMKLHMDYLCAHSALLRGLFSGASPSGLAMDAPETRSDFESSPSHTLSRQSSLSSLQYPTILPSSTCSHPVVHLPVPDPTSFHHLVHYIYFGSTSFMEEALDKGELTWEGLARNVEYFQMDSEVKLFLGRYWRRRAHSYPDYEGSESDCEYDSDYDEDSDEDAYMSEDDSTLADPEEDRMCMADDEDDDDLIMLKAKARARARDPPRGRQRTTRRLGHSTSDPVISHRAAEAGPSGSGSRRRNSSK